MKEPTNNKLTPQQMDFAQWLAIPPWERSPAMLKEKATQLRVTTHTLINWKELPELIQSVNDITAKELSSLVVSSVALLKQAIEQPGSVSRVSFDAARYIAQEWVKRVQPQSDVCNTIADIYKKYHSG